MQVLKSQALNKTHIESSDVSKPLLKQIHVESILEIKYQRECCPAEGWGLGGIGQLGLLNNKLSYLSYLFFQKASSTSDILCNVCKELKILQANTCPMNISTKIQIISVGLLTYLIYLLTSFLTYLKQKCVKYIDVCE